MKGTQRKKRSSEGGSGMGGRTEMAERGGKGVGVDAAVG